MNVEIGVRFIIGLQRIIWNGRKMMILKSYSFRFTIKMKLSTCLSIMLLSIH